MEDRHTYLRRKIAILFECLRDGVEANQASKYLQEIAEAERELHILQRNWQPNQC